MAALITNLDLVLVQDLPWNAPILERSEWVESSSGEVWGGSQTSEMSPGQRKVQESPPPPFPPDCPQVPPMGIHQPWAL